MNSTISITKISTIPHSDNIYYCKNISYSLSSIMKYRIFENSSEFLTKIYQKNSTTNLFNLIFQNKCSWRNIFLFFSGLIACKNRYKYNCLTSVNDIVRQKCLLVKLSSFLLQWYNGSLSSYKYLWKTLKSALTTKIYEYLSLFRKWRLFLFHWIIRNILNSIYWMDGNEDRCFHI